MRFIANILTDRKFEDCSYYNIVSDKKFLIKNIPTLVIGWELTKTLYPEANIISWEINEDTYWTFGNRERRQRYEENLVKFRELAVNRFIKLIKYKFISALDSGPNETALDVLLNNFSGFKVYINNDMVYATGKNTPDYGPFVYGFSLREYNYVGVDVKELLKKIYASNVELINTLDKIPCELKEILKNKTYAIPCLY